ncbi:hypothetical protein ACFX2F_042199 [Malus domestica]
MSHGVETAAHSGTHCLDPLISLSQRYKRKFPLLSIINLRRTNDLVDMFDAADSPPSSPSFLYTYTAPSDDSPYTIPKLPASSKTATTSPVTFDMSGPFQ